MQYVLATYSTYLCVYKRPPLVVVPPLRVPSRSSRAAPQSLFRFCGSRLVRRDGHALCREGVRKWIAFDFFFFPRTCMYAVCRLKLSSGALQGPEVRIYLETGRRLAVRVRGIGPSGCLAVAGVGEANECRFDRFGREWPQVVRILRRNY
ncbi:hypothetical protein BDY21DRAFT_347239 [Lineolata rhizophorae]|uniref:Uncharacterized protein n=1 Tax=Lineolata rhizophorae TaxID=578093 RepID=A0A6A6NYY7_9PEZI|nr:hypothetical protein BDY21DRAFT_347239 [Lineolata rhizophorae]